MNRMEQTISVILEENGCIIPVLNESLQLTEDLGLDSLRKVQVICDLEEKLKIEFDLEDLMPEKIQTVGDLFRIVRKHKFRCQEEIK